jgi:hypothetical protein
VIGENFVEVAGAASVESIHNELDSLLAQDVETDQFAETF